MTVLTNTQRIGNFTSSEIFALTKTDRSGKSWGAPALTYIEETKMERRLGRSLTDESKARPLVWGNLLEPIAFSKLSFDYELISQESIVHHLYDFWAGSPDGIKENTVFDIKCPITLKSFCQLVDPIYEGLEGTAAMDKIRADHSMGEKYYWQLVSNAILTGSTHAELIVYMPYQSELDEIKRIAIDNENCQWIWYSGDNELPYLIEGGYYKNINTIRFTVPEEDKVRLTECVVNAGKLLIQ